MTKENINKRLDELSREEFSIQMKDRWSDSDFLRIREIHKEERILKKMLEE